MNNFITIEDIETNTKCMINVNMIECVKEINNKTIIYTTNQKITFENAFDAIRELLNMETK